MKAFWLWLRAADELQLHSNNKHKQNAPDPGIQPTAPRAPNSHRGSSPSGGASQSPHPAATPQLAFLNFPARCGGDLFGPRKKVLDKPLNLCYDSLERTNVLQLRRSGGSLRKRDTRFEAIPFALPAAIRALSI